eukprot:6214805-Pleurochrysis_carterae.AAC.3
MPLLFPLCISFASQGRDAQGLAFLQGHQPLDFYRALAHGLMPHVAAIRRVYGHYAAAPKGGDPSISTLIFAKFVKALGLLEGPSSADRPGET